MDKRTFLKTGLMSTIALPMTSFIHNIDDDKTTVLFQGDSITDAGRDKAAYYPNQAQGMGTGYVHMAASNILGMYPERHLRIYNRGISGHKVFQLASRWDDDAVLLKPDVLSILIGVNDFWHTLTGGYNGTVETYETDFRNLLRRTKDALPNVKIIICEPFVVKGGSAFNDPKWNSVFPEYQASAKKLASEFNTYWVPFQTALDAVLAKGGAAYWCPDGVHPSLAGARVMADAWLKVYHQIG